VKDWLNTVLSLLPAHNYILKFGLSSQRLIASGKAENGLE